MRLFVWLIGLLQVQATKYVNVTYDSDIIDKDGFKMRKIRIFKFFSRIIKNFENIFFIILVDNWQREFYTEYGDL